MTNITLSMFVVLGFCLGAISMIVFFTADTISLEKYITPFITLVAVFIGARYAFELQEKRLSKVDITENVKIGNKALFDLIRIYNKFDMLRKQFIEPYRNNPDRKYLIPPIAGMNAYQMQLNYDALTFLFESKDPFLLTKLTLFEQEVSSISEVINQRSEHHYKVVQPAIEILKKKLGNSTDKFSSAQIDTELGSLEHGIIKQSTEYMIDGVDRIILNAENFTNSLHEILKNKYPNHKFLNINT